MTHQHYNRALDVLSSLELDNIIQDFTDTDQCKEIRQIIRFYRKMSETQLITIRDMLKFMLTIKSSSPAQKKMIVPPNPPLLSNSSKPLTCRTILQNKLSTLSKEKPMKYKKFSTAVSHMDSR